MDSARAEREQLHQVGRQAEGVADLQGVEVDPELLVLGKQLDGGGTEAVGAVLGVQGGQHLGAEVEGVVQEARHGEYVHEVGGDEVGA